MMERKCNCVTCRLFFSGLFIDKLKKASSFFCIFHNFIASHVKLCNFRTSFPSSIGRSRYRYAGSNVRNFWPCSGLVFTEGLHTVELTAYKPWFSTTSEGGFSRMYGLINGWGGEGDGERF